MPDDVKVQVQQDQSEMDRLKAAHAKAVNDAAAAKAKADKLEADHKALQAKHDAAQEELDALKVQFKLAQPKYVWKEGDSKCEPVVPGGKCSVCGWAPGDLDENKKPMPHPIAA